MREPFEGGLVSGAVVLSHGPFYTVSYANGQLVGSATGTINGSDTENLFFDGDRGADLRDSAFLFELGDDGARFSC